MNLLSGSDTHQYFISDYDQKTTIPRKFKFKDVFLEKALKSVSQDNFGQALKRIRILQKITQKEFAKRLGCSTCTIKRWENENRIPEKEYLDKIMELFPDDAQDIKNILEKAKEKEINNLPENTFGQKIRKVRLLNKLSREEFGALIGYSKFSIKHWEFGTRFPAKKALIMIQKVFGIMLE